MDSEDNHDNEELTLNALPPIICNNPRKKIEPKEVDPNILKVQRWTHREKPKSEVQLCPVPTPPMPCPRYPLAITWCPDQLNFELNEEPVIHKLWIYNDSRRLIYIHCCGLWNEMARFGAGWRVYPRTRFLLAPGLKVDLFVKATPRPVTPVACVYVGLQLAASHLRDVVTCHFSVPVVAKFLKYRAPCLSEEE